MIEIDTVIKRTENDGLTEPYICTAGNDVYFVKDIGIGLKTVVNEAIAAQLAFQLGLPIAPFDLVKIDHKLLEYETRPEMSSLKSGIAFGSKKVDGRWIEYREAYNYSDDLKNKLLLFDYWIKNSDRTLTEAGGNPNLIKKLDDNSLVIFDHNLAFSTNFDKTDFLNTHIFRSQWDVVTGDLFLKNEFIDIFSDILNNWDSISDYLPLEWYDEYDVERNIDINMYLERIYIQLRECELGVFWNV